MDRKEFLHLFGLGAAGLLASACLGSCGNSSDPVPAAANVDFTVDLTAASSANLHNAAVGYLYNAERTVIVAKTADGRYVAFQAPCPHEGVTVTFSPNQARFVCPRHNAVFGADGAVLSGPAPRALKQYTVTQTGSTLRITG
ncbi:Rieske (2Fe-2S) protein [Hymenobacter sp. 15J16-1T3B]|uniref:QcrA and Rieske domain-containing protein n=1 Tax=Hymenobacter sp. 15J16-1T3B TaxID=2886941 RepID=UPI001D119CCE|nr:Rieske (2Fe-2S) protein [Hymenobacter sp. 15J16-1T3B]MCC3160372.1 Rieske (2Fe-2S) protein [Hymenobacter sp. 15J16-1T3B]